MAMVGGEVIACFNLYTEVDLTDVFSQHIVECHAILLYIASMFACVGMPCRQLMNFQKANLTCWRPCFFWETLGTERRVSICSASWDGIA